MQSFTGFSFLVSAVLVFFSTSLVPQAFCVWHSSSNAVTQAAINDLNSLYSFCLDEKNFDLLAEVYTTDAVLEGGVATTIGGAGDTITGIGPITNFWRKIFANASLVTQHTVSTIYTYNFTHTTASSKHYASAFYFGSSVQEQGNFLFRNDSIVTRQRFDNQYVKRNGSWKISRQKGPQVIVRSSSFPILFFSFRFRLFPLIHLNYSRWRAISPYYLSSELVFPLRY